MICGATSIPNGPAEQAVWLVIGRALFRNRSIPTGVQQELWGIFLADNLVRLEIERVASESGVESTRISFVVAL